MSRWCIYIRMWCLYIYIWVTQFCKPTAVRVPEIHGSMPFWLLRIKSTKLMVEHTGQCSFRRSLYGKVSIVGENHHNSSTNAYESLTLPDELVVPNFVTLCWIGWNTSQRLEVAAIKSIRWHWSKTALAVWKPCWASRCFADLKFRFLCRAQTEPVRICRKLSPEFYKLIPADWLVSWFSCFFFGVVCQMIMTATGFLI